MAAAGGILMKVKFRTGLVLAKDPLDNSRKARDEVQSLKWCFGLVIGWGAPNPNCVKRLIWQGSQVAGRRDQRDGCASQLFLLV